ncbi:MAG: glycosyltransferase [Verrucomicrobiia bacterium]
MPKATTPPKLVLAGKLPPRSGRVFCDVERAIAASGVDPHLILKPGFIAAEDLPLLYRSAEALIFPSLGEGFGLTPMEAMACGCPALVADNTSLREVVTDAAYRFATDSPGSLARLLLEASRKRLPLNPGFNAEYFSQQRAESDLRRILIDFGHSHLLS